MSATVSHIHEGSIAEKAGLKKGDVILGINNTQVKDVIDYMFNSAESSFTLKVKRGNRNHLFKIEMGDSHDIGFEIKPFRTKSCRNKCVFCFVDQLPKGMRKSLYLKDDDYRMSFLYGNFITFTNLTAAEKKRIIEQRLSPLYISVHTTNSDLRRKMLGNNKAPDILKEIQDLVSHKIRIHAQIVICPGINDGEELSNTIRDLQKFYPYISSIALVPVGITSHRKSGLKPVDKKNAIEIIEMANSFRRRFKRRHGEHILYIADELYLKAKVPFPALSQYGDLPQLENGVGLIPSFKQSAKKLKLPLKIKPGKFAVFTGASFMPYLTEFVEKLNTIKGLTIEVFRIENRMFGPSVSVAGLLSGKDVLKAILGKTKAECLLVPDVMLRSGTDIFLDNVSLKDMEETLGIHVKLITATPEGLLKGIKDGY